MTLRTAQRCDAASMPSRLAGTATPAYLDPLDRDEPTDPVLIVTERSLVRLALVACETATRFQREGVRHDPMAWLLAPRRLFEGRRAIDAALDREDCLRAVLMHGLALGLDASPDEVDSLTRGGGSDRSVPSRCRRSPPAVVGMSAGFAA